VTFRDHVGYCGTTPRRTRLTGYRYWVIASHRTDKPINKSVNEVMLAKSCPSHHLCKHRVSEAKQWTLCCRQRSVKSYCKNLQSWYRLPVCTYVCTSIISINRELFLQKNLHVRANNV